MVIQQASVAERIGPIRSTVYGRVFNVISVPRAVNVAYTPLELKLHQDLMYLESSPGLQLLHCLKSDATGGESTVADGFKVPSSVHILIDGAGMLTRMYVNGVDYQRVSKEVSATLQDLGYGTNDVAQASPRS